MKAQYDEQVKLGWPCSYEQASSLWYLRMLFRFLITTTLQCFEQILQNAL